MSQTRSYNNACFGTSQNNVLKNVFRRLFNKDDVTNSHHQINRIEDIINKVNNPLLLRALNKYQDEVKEIRGDYKDPSPSKQLKRERIINICNRGIVEAVETICLNTNATQKDKDVALKKLHKIANALPYVRGCKTASVIVMGIAAALITIGILALLTMAGVMSGGLLAPLVSLGLAGYAIGIGTTAIGGALVANSICLFRGNIINNDCPTNLTSVNRVENALKKLR